MTDIAEGMIWQPALGQTIFAGPWTGILRNLDQAFVRLGRGFQPIAHQFGTFVSAQEIQKLDYFRSFPHLINFPVNLADESDNLKKFSERQNPDAEGNVKLEKISPLKEVLTPAACYHFYILHQGRAFASPQYFTTQCRCFRREKVYQPLRRQWNFDMREIVSIGTRESTESFVKELSQKVTEFATLLGLKAPWLTATDPFFNPSQNPKYLMQKLDPVKSELTFGGDLAIASTNLHRNYFGDAFKIQCEGQEAYTACVAFGLERWMAALLETFGPEWMKWPSILLEGVER